MGAPATVLRGLAIIRTTRVSRRAGAIHALNAGGLTWQSVRRRAAEAHKHANDNDAPRLDFNAPNGNGALPLTARTDEPSGIRGIPLQCYVESRGALGGRGIVAR